MNNQNNNGTFFGNVPNNQNMNNGSNFDPNTGQPINNAPLGAPMAPPQPQPEPAPFNGFAGQPVSDMNSAPMGAPIAQPQPEPAPFNGFAGQPVNDMNSAPMGAPIAQPQPQPEPAPFNGFAGQPVNDINSAPMGAPMAQPQPEPAPFNGFAGQPVNDMNSASMGAPMAQPQPTAMPMNFDPNTGQPIPAGTGATFDPNTGMPINGMNINNTNTSKGNKKVVFIVIGCIVAAIALFFVFGVKVTTCSNDDEQFGVEVTTKVTSVAIFGDVKSAKFVMEYDFSDVDEDEKEELMESLIETFEDEEDCKIKEKGDKIIISMEGFKDEEKGDYPIDEFIDNAEDLGLTCK